MPFNADTRCGLFQIQLHIGCILEALEEMLEKEYDGDLEKGSDFWLYVYQLENELEGHLNCGHKIPDFWIWFSDNYNNVYQWNKIQDKFVDEV